jgi:hypothetical protein
VPISFERDNYWGYQGGESEMKRSTITANFAVVGSEKAEGAERALERWICRYSKACGIDVTNPICPRFIMANDSIESYKQAVAAFGELWIYFNDAGLDEASFMSAYSAAQQKITGKRAKHHKNYDAM